MPFITLNNSWSDLARYYNSLNNGNGSFIGGKNNPNVTNTDKPQIPNNDNQFKIGENGFVRGGSATAALSVKQDLTRLKKFLFNKDKDNSTNGYLFLARQAALQLSNPRLEWKKNPDEKSPLLGGFNRQYTGIGSTLSVATTAFGVHFDQPGLTGNVPADQKYGGDVNSPLSGIAYTNNFSVDSKNEYISDASHNRLLRYTAKIINSDLNKDISVVKLDSYLGGPNSVYGLGTTDVLPYYNSTFIKDSDISRYSPSGLYKRLNNFIPLKNYEIAEYEKDSPSTSLRTVLVSSPFYTKSVLSDLINNNESAVNIEDRVGISTTTQNPISPSSVDSINIIKVVDSKVFYEDFKGKKTSEAVGYIGDPGGKEANGTFGKDLIKFRIEFLNNDVVGYKDSNNRSVPKTDVLTFRAYLDGFDDGMSAKWSSYRYMGRGEEFYVYGGFTRDISVSFTMFAHTSEEMGPLYEKLNYLLSTFAPDYTKNLKMRGNIGYLTVGDYLYRQPGIFTDIKIGGFFDGSWNIGLDAFNNEESEHYDNELPMMLKITLSFKPIHTFLPRKTKKSTDEGYKDIPFIGRDNVAYFMPPPKEENFEVDNTPESIDGPEPRYYNNSDNNSTLPTINLKKLPKNFEKSDKIINKQFANSANSIDESITNKTSKSPTVPRQQALASNPFSGGSSNPSPDTIRRAIYKDLAKETESALGTDPIKKLAKSNTRREIRALRSLVE